MAVVTIHRHRIGYRDMTLTAGTKLGPYEIMAPLGAGGMGEVYRARDQRLGREVALKVLAAGPRDPERLARFAREARAAAAVRHPNILAVYDVGTDEEPFLVSELLEGETLREAIAPNTPWPIGKVVDLARQIAAGLAAAHARGVVHRDLKPENIFLGDDGVVKILDFGLARLAEPIASARGHLTTQAVTQEGSVLGTMGYMSPEQLRGQPADHRADIFAFGAVLYELVTGKRAFAGESAADTITAILTKGPDDLDGLANSVSPPLAHIVARCLDKRPEARFQSASDLAFALQALSDEPAPLKVPRPWPGLSRRRMLWASGTTLAAAATGAAVWRLWPHSSGVRSLAVLPFVNSAKDEDADYLCDGITESLIYRIGRLSSLRVMARSTVFNFKGTNADPREVGRKLGVDAILTGTIIRRRGRLIISAELVEVRSGVQLWGDSFDRAATDILTTQDEVAYRIVEDGIRLRLTGEERRQLASHPTEDTEAYEAFLRGIYLLRHDTEDDYLKARELFLRAIARDPRFAQAYVGVSFTYALSALSGFQRPVDMFPAGDTSVRRALELDAKLADAHHFLGGQAFFFRWDWADAEREFRMAESLGGSNQDPDLLREWALHRWALGRIEEAIALARQAREVDPVSPAFAVGLADYLLHAGRLEEAADLYEEVIRDDPTDARAYFGLAEVRRLQVRFDDAIEARRRGHLAVGDDSLDETFRTAKGEMGYRRIEEAAVRRELEGLNERVQEAYVSPLDFARAYAQLGETEKAFSYFELAFADRAAGLVFLNVDRAWDRLRKDPRFESAVRRVGLS